MARYSSGRDLTAVGTSPVAEGTTGPPTFGVRSQERIAGPSGEVSGAALHEPDCDRLEGVSVSTRRCLLCVGLMHFGRPQMGVDHGWKADAPGSLGHDRGGGDDRVECGPVVRVGGWCCAGTVGGWESESGRAAEGDTGWGVVSDIDVVFRCGEWRCGRYVRRGIGRGGLDCDRDRRPGRRGWYFAGGCCVREHVELFRGGFVVSFGLVCDADADRTMERIELGRCCEPEPAAGVRELTRQRVVCERDELRGGRA